MKKLNKKGFTLIELIVVIAILAILAAILIPAVTGYIAKAQDAANKANCRAVYAEVSLQVLLDQALTYETGDVVGKVTFTIDADEDANIITNFSCAMTGGVDAVLDLK